MLKPFFIAILSLLALSSPGQNNLLFLQKKWPAFTRNSDTIRPVSVNGWLWSVTGDNDRFPTGLTGRTGLLHCVLQTPAMNDTSRHAPLNISIVIDRSGSMQGVKLGFAKKAAKAIIDMLTPADIVSIVMYDNSVDSVQSPVHVTNKDGIKSRIDKITPRGSTNLWGGTELGYQFVERNYATAFVNRVLLLSDGLANAGITDSTIICRNVQQYSSKGMSLSAFGLGLDYNEWLMTAMAEKGGGNFYNISVADQLTTVFRSEIHQLWQRAAIQAMVTLTIPSAVSIKTVYPYSYRTQANQLTIEFPNLFYRETRSFIIYYRIQDGWSQPFEWKSTVRCTPGEGNGFDINKNFLVSPATPAVYAKRFSSAAITENLVLTANQGLEDILDQAGKGNELNSRKTLSSVRALLDSNRTYVTASSRLAGTDSLVRSYAEFLSRSSTITKDTVNAFQKATRAINYRIRNNRQ